MIVLRQEDRWISENVDPRTSFAQGTAFLAQGIHIPEPAWMIVNGRPMKLLLLVWSQLQWPRELQVQNLSHEALAELARREHQARRAQMDREQLERAMCSKFAEQQMQEEEQAQKDEDHLTAATGYERAITGTVPTVAPPSSMTTGTMKMSNKVSPECLGASDPVDLPLVTVPPLLYSKVLPLPVSSTPPLPPPTPLLRQDLSQSERAFGLPATKEAPPLHSPPPVDLDSTQHPVRTPASSAAYFTRQFPAPPRTDALQAEVSHQSSSDRHSSFPERFQSGRAATRRHRPSHYRVDMSRSSRLKIVATPAIIATEKELRAQ